MHRIKNTTALFLLKLFENVNFALMWKNYLLVKKHRKVNFVIFLIQCILDYTQRHLVDFWKKRPANFNFIWLQWNSNNSSIQFHIVWSCSSFFKLKCSVDHGCRGNQTWGILGEQKNTVSWFLVILRVKIYQSTQLCTFSTLRIVVRHWDS